MKEARAELVRIDDRGEAHPIGNVASQRMRARQGAYRLLPAPGHVVFMRFTGEDGRRDEEDGAIVRLAGEITNPGAICDIFAMIAQSGWRGELVVLDGGTSRAMFFEHGNVVGAQTTVDDERLGMVMYRFGAITEEQHTMIMNGMSGGGRFGATAMELGILSQESVYQYLRKQVEEIVFATFSVGDGTFFFLEGFDEKRIISRQAMPAGMLIMDGVTRMDEMRYFSEKIPSSDYIPAKVPGKEPPAEEYQATYDAVDDVLSIEELGRQTGRGDFGTTKDIYALLQTKHVTIHPPRLSGGLPAITAVANEALRAIHREADAVGKGTTLRQALASFASGAGVYDMLFRGAGPDDQGVLDAEKVGANVQLVATGDPEHQLKQMLHEYVGFALFSAGAALGKDTENKLAQELSPMVARLQPQG